MAAELGNRRKAYICAYADDITDADDAIWIGCETSNSLNLSQDAVECSDKSSDCAKFLQAKRGGTYEVTAYADNGNAGQIVALKGLFNGAKIKFAVAKEVGGDFEEMEYGVGVVTAISDTHDFGAVSSRQISIQADSTVNTSVDLDDDDD